jgi:predicted MPP superfamily phosphohydrolase
MAQLILDNLPDELLQQIEKLAQQKNSSVNEQTINLLKIALEKAETPLKIMVSPDNDPTWEERVKNTPKILAEIAERRKLRENQANIQWLDSTELIREDRDNR